MKRLLLLPVCLLHLQITAQPVLNRIEDVQPGHKMEYVLLAAVPDPGEAGENKVWNFADAARKTKGAVLSESISANDAAYKAKFPAANIIRRKNDGALSFIEKTAELNKIWGGSGSGVELYFSEPYWRMKRPMRYNDSIASQPKYHHEAFGGYRGSGNTKTIADGWGTLKLPTGSYKVLRVRFEQNGTDVANTDSLVTKSKIVVYAWYDAAHAEPLFRITVVEHAIPGRNYIRKTETAELLVSEDGKRLQ